MGTGKEIKRLRTTARLSAEKAAEFMGIKADRLRKWEAMDLEPRDDDARKLVDFFGRSLEKLGEIEKFDFSNSVPNTSNLKPVKEETDPAKKEALEQAILNLSEAELINAKNMERLTLLLERKWDMVGMELPDKGDEGTVTMKPNKKAAH